MNKNTICLWYDDGAEEAARFYAQTFPDSTVDAVHRAESAVAQQDWARAWGFALTALFVSEQNILPNENAP